MQQLGRNKQDGVAGLGAGLIGGLISAWLVAPPLGWGVHLLLSALLGGLFGLTLGRCVRSGGAGLAWGQSFGLLWWGLGSLTLLPLLRGQGVTWQIEAMRGAFDQLLAQVAGFGAVMGLSYYALKEWLLSRWLPQAPEEAPADMRFPTPEAIMPAPAQAILIGGLGGLLGSWVFVRGIETAKFYPLVAGLVRAESATVGQVLHYLIGMIIGISFGLLFSPEMRRVGPGLIWGMSYGLLWWMIGPLTLAPLIHGMRPDWSLSAAQANAASLIAHMLYGAMVGWFYALVNKLWRVLFVDADPLNRALEGAGTRGLRSVLMGQAGGIVGGLLFTIVMVGVGALPGVASLVGARSDLVGFVVHLVISIIVGSSYGLLFQQREESYSAGLAWGMLYGLLWWLLGGLTLFDVLLGRPVNWSLETIVGQYPSLIGHLLYGAGLGVLFQYLAERYTPVPRRWWPDGRPVRQVQRPRLVDLATPALWVVTLFLGVILPLFMGMGPGA